MSTPYEGNNMNLDRFIKGHELDYAQAFSEIKAGRKQSHWIWYIFPQIHGLGMSATSEKYAIQSSVEAREYMEQPLLKAHMLEICDALLRLEDSDPTRVMGYPDDLKLCSSMTLFSEVCPEYDIFQKVLDKYYGGKKDRRTIEILNSEQ